MKELMITEAPVALSAAELNQDLGLQSIIIIIIIFRRELIAICKWLMHSMWWDQIGTDTGKWHRILIKGVLNILRSWSWGRREFMV